MKKTYLIIITILTLLSISLFIILVVTKKATKYCMSDNKYNNELHNVLNIKNYAGEIEDFRIFVNGEYSDEITGEFINNEKIQVYEFDAVINDSWTIHKDHYIGVKLLDVLNKKGFHYNNITFSTEGLLSVTYTESQITDKTYLVFKRNGKSINDGKVALLSVDFNYKYSIENLYKITIQPY